MLTPELSFLSREGQYVFLQAYFLKAPWTWIALAAAVYLWFARKESRWQVLIPLMIMLAAMATPPAYQFSFRRYWRLFWAIPRGWLTALAAIDLIRRLRNQWIRLLCVALAGAAIVCTGASWFDDKSVKPAYTPYKIDEGLPELCDRMLAEQEHPKAIFTGPWGPLMVRQYASEIELLWGRNAFTDKFILPLMPEAKEVYAAWNTDPHNWDVLFAYAAEHGYDYIGTTAGAKKMKEAAKQYGYTRIMTAGEYKLYAKKSRAIRETAAAETGQATEPEAAEGPEEGPESLENGGETD